MTSPVGAPGLYHQAAYDIAAPPPSYWRDSARPGPALEPLGGDAECEVAIVGGGYTGLSAALHLARDHGIAALVLEAGEIGWGASGRNGGFCVPGGAKRDLIAIARRFGDDEARRFARLTLDAVARVEGLLKDEAIEAAPQPGGEMLLAHSGRALAALARRCEAERALTGHDLRMLTPQDLRDRGQRADAYAGALWEPVGFGLHPLDYVRGLAAAAQRRGASIAPHSPVTHWSREGGFHRLVTPRGAVRCAKVIVAAGAYQPEGLAPALAGRILPVQSNILVTRPLTPAEVAGLGWSSTGVASDSFELLHYFRLLPTHRLLFGARGGLSASPRRAASFQARLMRDFRGVFGGVGVEVTHFWSGLVDLAADRLPHCSATDGDASVFQACAYHGSGVAMGTELGAQLAGLAAGGRAEALPGFMMRPPPRFPLPGLRKVYLAAALTGYAIRDAL